jgi:ArsR family transcriptional regulator, arsenate/arsenite/antimonite-responsive transcriptional repressor / arsenate reductase (thioredoxin)
MIPALGIKASTLSVYLAALERAGLIASRRDGKSILYSIDLREVGTLVDYLVADCCRGRPELCVPLAQRSLQRPDRSEAGMTDRPYNVLFICVGNSARSIIAEAILSDIGSGKFRAFSAGTKPYSEMNPYALEVLENLGHDVSTLRAKNVAEFQRPDAPTLDFVFTLCNAAANEECPPWPGQPITAHWGMADPVKVTGTDAEKALAFKKTYGALRRRLSALVALPLEALDRISLQRRLDAIGREDAADQHVRSATA